jgi:predicted chitinase
MAEKFTNIAGSPFQDYVSKQIETRKEFINEFDNPSKVNNNHIIYQNNRNAWIRLTSNVNIKPTHKLWSKYNLQDPQTFSKKYILQGGLIDNQNNINRSGIGENKLYGTLPNRPLGLKPLPGITSIDVSSAGKLGTLQYADIKFICYDIEQLEIMDALYMKLGFSLFLEWGHTYYLDNNDLNSLKQISPLDIFSYNSKEEIIKAIQNKRVETSGNYDAMLGTVSNFNWEVQNDGSYMCGIKLVGAGDILESLKINQSINKNTDYSSLSNSNINEEDLQEENQNSTIGDRDLSLLNRALFEINQVISSKSKKISNKIGVKDTEYRNILNKIFTNSPIDFIKFNQDGKIISDSLLSLKGYHYSLLNELEKNPNNIPDINGSLFNCISVKYNITDSTNNSSDPTIQTYISLGNLLCILNCTGMIYDSNNGEKGNPYIYCDFNDSLNYCKTFKGQLSINPLVCLVPRNQSYNEDPFGLGITKDKVFDNINGGKEIETRTRLNGVNYYNTSFQQPTSLAANYLNTSEPKSKAKLMHILVNINHITDILRELRSNDDKGNVYYSDFLNNLLLNISKSLGGFNEFRLLIDDSSKSLRIIDDNKLNNIEESDNLKYTELPIFGKNSIIYDYSFKSKIGPNMACMVTIAAQYKPSTLGEDSFAISNLSRGLEDRLMINKLTSNDINKNIEENTNTTDNFKSLSLHLSNILEGNSSGFTINKELIEPSYNTYKDILAKFNVKYNPNNKGTTIIPLDFSISMDGISGIIPNSAFIIPVNLLPFNYRTKNSLPKIAFILHTINQDFSNNKWITKLTGQALNIRFDEEDNIENIQSNNPNENKISNDFVILNEENKFLFPDSCSRRAENFFNQTLVKTNINYLKQAARNIGLLSPQSISSLIAISGGESGMIPQSEKHIYSESRLRQVFPNLSESQYKRASKSGILKQDFFKIVYGEYYPSRVGNRTIEDGGKYYGRGYIQLTGYGNYQRYAKLSGIDIINKPELVNDPIMGAKIAAIYFNNRVKISQFDSNYFQTALSSVGYNIKDIKTKKIEYYNCYINKV